MIKALYHDIDGCLNPESGEAFVAGDVAELSSAQLEMLARVSRAVDESSVEHLVLNTGRNFKDTDFISRAMPLKKLRYLLLEHGAYAYDMIEEKRVDLENFAESRKLVSLHEKYQSLDLIKEVIAWYKDRGQAKVEKIVGHAMPPLEKEANLSVMVPSGFKAQEISMILEKEILKVFTNTSQGALHFCHSTHFSDVIGGVQKSDGAKLMNEILGITQSEAMVVGDGVNDLDMFELFPNLLSPANACEEILKICASRGGIVSKHGYGGATLNFLENLRSSS